jgi:hypothetical protein
MSTHYQLVQYVEGEGLVSAFFSEECLLPAMSLRGFEFAGFSDNKRLRPELQGQPKFCGLNGPMWNGINERGEPIVRYETVQAYAVLSA